MAALVCYTRLVNKPKQKKPIFLPIGALTFVNILGLTIFMPVLPFIVQGYGAPTWVYGLLLASYPAAMFFGSPILGEMSDRVGRKPVLIISQIGTLISWIILGAAYFIGEIDGIHPAWPIGVLLFARIMDGLTGGNISVVNAYLTDITSHKDLTEIFGKVGVITGFAVVVGPALGSYSSSTSIGYLGMAIVAIIISAVTLVLMWKYLQESLTNPSRAVRTESRLQQINIVSRIAQLKVKSGGKLMLLINAGFSMVIAGYTSIIALFLIDQFKLNQTQVGNFLVIAGGMLIFNQYVIVPRLANRIGDIRTFLAGMVLLGIGLVLITLTNTIWLAVVMYYILNLGISLVLPTGKSLVSRAVEPEQQGEMQGVDESLRSATRAVMPVIVGALYGIYAYRTFHMLAFLSFIVVAVYVIIGTDRIKPLNRFRAEPDHIEI